MDRWRCLLRGTLGLFSASSAASASGHLLSAGPQPDYRSAADHLADQWSIDHISDPQSSRHSHGQLRAASARVRAPVCRDDAPASRGGISFTALHRSRGPRTITACKTWFVYLVFRISQPHKHVDMYVLFRGNKEVRKLNWEPRFFKKKFGIKSELTVRVMRGFRCVFIDKYKT